MNERRLRPGWEEKNFRERERNEEKGPRADLKIRLGRQID
jgi:hypothetical protein